MWKNIENLGNFLFWHKVYIHKIILSKSIIFKLILYIFVKKCVICVTQMGMPVLLVVIIIGMSHSRLKVCATSCLIFMHLYRLDPSKNCISCSLTHYKMFFERKNSGLNSKIFFYLGLQKRYLGSIFRCEGVLRGLNFVFLSDKSQFFFLSGS